MLERLDTVYREKTGGRQQVNRSPRRSAFCRRGVGRVSAEALLNVEPEQGAEQLLISPADTMRVKEPIGRIHSERHFLRPPHVVTRWGMPAAFRGHVSHAEPGFNPVFSPESTQIMSSRGRAPTLSVQRFPRTIHGRVAGAVLRRPSPYTGIFPQARKAHATIAG